jgi:hypothetical protein
MVSEPEKPLTPEMVLDYIAGHGAHCPFCDSPEIESGRLEADGASAWAPVKCSMCHREWQDVFFLGAVDIIHENGDCGEPVMPAPDDPNASVKSDAPTPFPPDVTAA